MPQVPSRNEVQTLLSALLITRKEAFTSGVPVALLDQDYRAQEGTRIPFRQLGYTCLLDFLQSLTGGMCVKHKNGSYYAYPLVTEKSRHVSQLVAGQNSKRTSHSGRRVFRPSPCYPRLPQPSMRLDSATMAEIVGMVKASQTEGVHKNRVLEYARYRLNCDVDAYDLGRQLREVSHEIVIEGDMVYPASRYMSLPRDSWANDYSQRQVPPNATENGHLCNARPAGHSDSEDEDGDDEEFAIASVDAEDIHQTTRRDEDIAAREEQPPNDEDTRQVETEEHMRREENESIAVLISERTRFRLKKLIEKHPDGIWCAELPALYQQAYTIPLNYEELGFGSVIDYAAHLPEIFHYARPRDKGDFKLFDAQATKPNIKPSDRPKVPSLASLHNIYEQYVEPTEPVPSVLCQSTVDKLIPDGVMTIGETVAQICVTEVVRGIHDYIDVIVCDVFTPSFFWIQFLKRMPKFNIFMNELHEFYERHASKYTLPLAVMEKGMNCACMYDGKWHRGIVKKIRPDSYVTVMFYDYGTVKSYQPECIHFLHRSFSNLPAQAIPCGLYNLKPTTGTRWSRSVACEFVARATNVPLVATVASMDTDNNSMMVCLTNTEEKEDFHINDWMVQNGLAIYGKMVRIRPPNYPFQRFLDCNFLKSSDRGEPSKSGDSNNVNLSRASVAVASASVNNARSAKYYETLLKLCRESRAAESTSILPIRDKPGRENSFSKDVESRAVESREGKIIADDPPVREADDSCALAPKQTRPRMRRELFMRCYESTKMVREDVLEGRSNEDLTADASADRSIGLPLHLADVDGATLTEFGTLRSRLGGHGRMEHIDWSEVRARLKRPENNVAKLEQRKDVPLNVRPLAPSAPHPAKRSDAPGRTITKESPMAKPPSKLPKASSVFVEIANEIVSGGDENSNLTCVPDGNIKSGGDFKPWLRTMTNKLSEDRRGSTKLFIPSSLLELMRATITDLANSSNEDRNNEETGIVGKASSESLAEMSLAPSTGTSESNDPIEPAGSNDNGSHNSRHVPERSTRGESVDTKAVEGSSTTRKKLTTSDDSRASAGDDIRAGNSTRDINAWLKTARIRPRNQQLFNLIASRLTPSNNSELGADDLSAADEEREREMDSSNISNLEIINEKNEQLAIFDKSAVDSSLDDREDDRARLAEISKESRVRSTAAAPIVDDVDMESDADTWDGWCGPRVLDASRRNLSESSDCSRGKIDDEAVENEHKYRVMDETGRSNRTRDSTFAERDSSAESPDAPASRNLSDDRQPLIDPDEDSISDEETAELRPLNPIGENGQSSTTPYPILREIQKPNILNTSKAFDTSEGNSSSGRSDGSRGSLVNTVKKAFLTSPRF